MLLNLFIHHNELLYCKYFTNKWNNLMYTHFKITYLSSVILIGFKSLYHLKDGSGLPVAHTLNKMYGGGLRYC